MGRGVVTSQTRLVADNDSCLQWINSRSHGEDSSVGLANDLSACTELAWAPNRFPTGTVSPRFSPLADNTFLARVAVDRDEAAVLRANDRGAAASSTAQLQEDPKPLLGGYVHPIGAFSAGPLSTRFLVVPESGATWRVQGTVSDTRDGTDRHTLVSYVRQFDAFASAEQRAAASVLGLTDAVRVDVQRVVPGPGRREVGASVSLRAHDPRYSLVADVGHVVTSAEGIAQTATVAIGDRFDSAERLLLRPPQFLPRDTVARCRAEGFIGTDIGTDATGSVSVVPFAKASANGELRVPLSFAKLTLRAAAGALRSLATGDPDVAMARSALRVPRTMARGVRPTGGAPTWLARNWYFTAGAELSVPVNAVLDAALYANVGATDAWPERAPCVATAGVALVRPKHVTRAITTTPFNDVVPARVECSFSWLRRFSRLLGDDGLWSKNDWRSGSLDFQHMRCGIVMDF